MHFEQQQLHSFTRVTVPSGLSIIRNNDTFKQQNNYYKIYYKYSHCRRGRAFVEIRRRKIISIAPWVCAFKLYLIARLQVHSRQCRSTGYQNHDQSGFDSRHNAQQILIGHGLRGSNDSCDPNYNESKTKPLNIFFLRAATKKTYRHFFVLL